MVSEKWLSRSDPEVPLFPQIEKSDPITTGGKCRRTSARFFSPRTTVGAFAFAHIKCRTFHAGTLIIRRVDSYWLSPLHPSPSFRFREREPIYLSSWSHEKVSVHRCARARVCCVPADCVRNQGSTGDLAQMQIPWNRGRGFKLRFSADGIYRDGEIESAGRLIVKLAQG